MHQYLTHFTTRLHCLLHWLKRKGDRWKGERKRAKGKGGRRKKTKGKLSRVKTGQVTLPHLPLQNQVQCEHETEDNAALLPVFHGLCPKYHLVFKDIIFGYKISLNFRASPVDQW